MQGSRLFLITIQFHNNSDKKQKTCARNRCFISDRVRIAKRTPSHPGCEKVLFVIRTRGANIHFLLKNKRYLEQFRGIFDTLGLSPLPCDQANYVYIFDTEFTHSFTIYIVLVSYAHVKDINLLVKYCRSVSTLVSN